MPDYSKRAQKKFGQHLRPDEQFVFAGVVQPKGSLSRGVNEAGARATHVIANVVAGKMDRGEDGLLASSIPTRNGYLVVTTQRIAWVRQGRMGGPTDDIETEFTAGDVAEVGSDTGSGFGNTELTLDFVDGSATQLLAHKSQRPERILAAIQTLIAGNPQPH